MLVTFVESVTGELENHVPHCPGLLFWSAPVPTAPSMNCFIVLGDHVFFLFADRFDARVGSGQRNFPQPVEDLHDLFLVDHHAMRFFQDLLEHREFVLGWSTTIFDIDVLLNHARLPAGRVGTARWWR